MSGTERLLCELLSCGSEDLSLLEDVGYDWGDVLEQLDWLDGEGFGFNRLISAVFDVGIIRIRGAVDDRVCELETISNERELCGDEVEELRCLRLLEPDNDIRSYLNCLDTHIWFEKNGELYQMYLAHALDSFADNTGFEIQAL